MKKTLALCLTGALLVLSLASCGSAKDYMNYEKTDLSAYVEAGPYADLTVEVPQVDPVTDEDVDEEIQSTLKSHAKEQEVDRAAANGDTVNIDFVGTMDGVAFEGGTDTGYEMVLGEGSMIDGFEDGIVGMTAGDKKTLDLTFPDPYENNPDLAGKAAQFEIKLNTVKVTPELTDDFVAELTGDGHSHIDDAHKDSIKTVEDYRAYVREQLEETRRATVRENRFKYTWTAIVNGCNFKGYPEGAVKKLAKDLYNFNYTYFMQYDYAQYGFTPESLGITEENYTEQARETIKEELCLWAVAKANNIDATDEEVNAKLDELVAKTNESLSDDEKITAETYMKTTTRQSLKTKVLYDKVVGGKVESLFSETEAE